MLKNAKGIQKTTIQKGKQIVAYWLLEHWTKVLNDSLFKSFPDCPYLKDQCSQRDTSATYAKEKLYPFTQETLTLKKTLHPSSGSKDSLIKSLGNWSKLRQNSMSLSFLIA